MHPQTTSNDEKAAAAGGPEPHAIACMEIWGGNETIDSAISSPGIDAWVYSTPYAGADAGGDIHYVSMCNSGKIARFFVADVSGHGAAVAEAARMLRALMRKNINTLDNTRFTCALNESFQMDRTEGKYATAVLASYFAPTDELVVVNAGHPRPLHLPLGGSWRVMAGCEGPSHASSSAPTNLPIGIIDPTEFSQFVLPLGRGDLVFFYTDGLMEARTPSGEMLGEAGLLSLIARLDPARPDRIIPDLLALIVNFQEGAPIGDDVTCILLHHNASDPPRYSLAEQAAALARTIGLLPV